MSKDKKIVEKEVTDEDKFNFIKLYITGKITYVVAKAWEKEETDDFSFDALYLKYKIAWHGENHEWFRNEDGLLVYKTYERSNR